MERITVVQQQGFQCQTHFGEGLAPITTDEPAPLGTGTGPSPVQLLASAVGNCLTASFYFALKKFKNEPQPLRCEVQAEVGRNPDGKMRVLSLQAALHIQDDPATLEQLDRALAQFEGFCTVTQSVAAGIPVSIAVYGPAGEKLKG